MAQPGVVVAFSSRCGTTERIAHAAAVGVVNARALPRLRRLADDGHSVPPECADTLRRMKKEYVPPTEADIAGSPALMIVPTAGMTPASEAWQSFIALLDRMAEVRERRDRARAMLARAFALGEPESLRVYSRGYGPAGFLGADPVRALAYLDAYSTHADGHRAAYRLTRSHMVAGLDASDLADAERLAARIRADFEHARAGR